MPYNFLRDFLQWQNFCSDNRVLDAKNLIFIAMLRKQVIIIDDEKDFCKLMESYFLKRKYNVEVYYLLNEGLKALENHSTGIVFLDNNLPDGLGWQKISELREIYPGLKLHLLSGYNYISTAISGNDHVKFWHKPISFTELDEYFK
jgi:two-component system, OmpR family, response regulator